MVDKEIIEKVRKFVEEECNKLGACFKGAFDSHFIPTSNYAKQLAEKLNADSEIVELAAWLHDIGSIKGDYKNHHISGAEIAEKKLKELNYPEEKIILVKTCILNHRGSINNARKSAEEQIIAEADAMSHFDDVGGLLKQWKDKNFVRNKLLRSYAKLSEESKKLVKPKYESAMLLLK